MLRALSHVPSVYHLNEGHAALLTVALLAEEVDGDPAGAGEDDRERVRGRCVFTTHTPIAAGHDRFPLELVRSVLGDGLAGAIEANGLAPERILNLTSLAMSLSRYVNGVALRHSEVTREMFPGRRVRAITNGVHAETWTAEPMARVHDRHIPEWREDARYLRYTIGCPLAEIRAAHAESKAVLLAEIETRTGRALDPATLTLGFARRATAYKRPDLVLADMSRLRAIARAHPLQIVYAGKAHPRDEGGKELVRRVVDAARELGDELPVVYLEEYDVALCKRLVAGVDVWLNTPEKPLEASGTSGMKAALNGVPSLSILDGWWIEGHIEGITGWRVGDASPHSDRAVEAASLYDKLARVIAPLFYDDPLAFAHVMRSAIALNGSFFNVQRMLDQYVQNAYRLTGGASG